MTEGMLRGKNEIILLVLEAEVGLLLKWLMHT